MLEDSHFYNLARLRKPRQEGSESDGASTEGEVCLSAFAGSSKKEEQFYSIRV
jgi:hypothetical protein